MAKQKKDIFKTATEKLKKNHILQALILSTLIVNNAPLSATNQQSTELTAIEETTSPDLIIDCPEEYLDEAEKLKTLLYELQTQSQYGEYLISQLAENKTTIRLTKTNGSNMYYNNNIYLNVDKIKNAQSNYEKRSVKDSIAHEATHMLQNKLGIMQKIQDLPPKEAICMYLFTEFDATIKAYLSTNPYYETDTVKKITSTLNAITNITSYAMNSYIEKAISMYANRPYIPNHTPANEIMDMFNSMGVFPKLDLNNILNVIYEKIPENYKEKINAENEKYYANVNKILNQQEILQS